ncbi:hypothetical protein ACVBIL_16640 [Shewanella sp. 125m-7]
MILTLQSAVAMADDCAIAFDDCADSAEYKVGLASADDNTPLISDSHDDKDSHDNADQCAEQTSAVHVDDDCTECSNNCCSCCLTLMHPVALIQTVALNSGSSIFTFNSTSVEAPYYAFLRPPKALIV